MNNKHPASDETGWLEWKWVWIAILIGFSLGLIFGQPDYAKPKPEESMLGEEYRDYVLPPPRRGVLKNTDDKQ